MSITLNAPEYTSLKSEAHSLGPCILNWLLCGGLDPTVRACCYSVASSQVGRISSWEMKWKLWDSSVWGRGAEPRSPPSATYASLECNYWTWEVPGISKHMWCTVLSWCTAQLLAVYTTDLRLSLKDSIRLHRKTTWKNITNFLFL